ncbi:MAG: glycerophosphodiester phosphodiesterase family protein [Candidatus Nezhaarchaeota archaeon]|nr:glycerophosphodiester phosphodiesterase family protein [Candidatus Nezhaarchaeota archaeon]
MVIERLCKGDALSRVSVIAHRGASAYEPENTLRAIRRALDLGADMVEVDVRATRDGHIVVIHDATVDRTTSGRGYVKDMTLEELKRLDAGLGERIPTLQEVISLVKGRAGLVIEIKVPGIEEKVLKIVNDHKLHDDVIITSFHHPTLLRVKGLMARVRTGIIIASRPVRPVQLALDAKSDAIFPKYIYLDLEVVEEAHKQSLSVYPWTVDNLEDARLLIEMGVDGIVTNKPDILRQRTLMN